MRYLSFKGKSGVSESYEVKLKSFFTYVISYEEVVWGGNLSISRNKTVGNILPQNIYKSENHIQNVQNFPKKG